MCVYLKAFYIHLANRMQLPFTPTHQDSQVFIRRPLSLQCCYALPGSFAGCFIFRHLLMVVYGQLKAQRPSYSGDSYVRVRGLLPGLPWGWHFNPHTHRNPHGNPHTHGSPAYSSSNDRHRIWSRQNQHHDLCQHALPNLS